MTDQLVGAVIGAVIALVTLWVAQNREDRRQLLVVKRETYARCLLALNDAIDVMLELHYFDEHRDMSDFYQRASHIELVAPSSVIVHLENVRCYLGEKHEDLLLQSTSPTKNYPDQWWNEFSEAIESRRAALLRAMQRDVQLERGLWSRLSAFGRRNLAQR